MAYWRLIPFLEASGEVQMSIDRWLLQQHRLGNHPPTLRFYTWSPVAISLGYHQQRYPEFWANLNWKGQPIDLVRRPSGGRAVLHQGDLTYMVVTSGLEGTRQQVYEKICQFLIQGWHSLGVELHYGNGGRGYIHNPNCFGTTTQADLVDSNGNKLIGSAQLRQGKAILQHGSMLLEPAPDLFTQVFGEFAPHRVKLPIPISEDRLIPLVIESLTIAAQECFQVDLIPQPFRNYAL